METSYFYIYVYFYSIFRKNKVQGSMNFTKRWKFNHLKKMKAEPIQLIPR